MYDQTGVLTPEQIKAAAGYPPQMPNMQQIDDPYATASAPAMPGYGDQTPGYAHSRYDDSDPLIAERRRNAGMRAALAQGLSGFSDPNAPPIPQEYQKKIDQIRSMINPGPMERDYMNQVQAAYAKPPVHGLRARLAGLGKGLLLGEGIAGMVRGASDPTNMNLRYRLAQIAPMGQGAQMEQQFRNATLQRNKELAETAGIDPITGLETPMSAWRNAQAYWNIGRPEREDRKISVAEKNAESLRTRRNDQTSVAKRRLDIQGFNAEVNALVRGNVVPDASVIQSIAQRYPDMILPQGFDPTKHQLSVDAAGNEILVNTSGANAGAATGVTRDNKPVTSFKKTQDETSRANAKVAAGGRSTPEERSQDRAIRQGHLTVAQQDEQRKAEASARKQAESENPLPPFASSQQIQDRNTKVEARVSEIMSKKQSTQSTPSPVQSGEKIIKRQMSPSTGEVFLTIQKADGTTYVRKQ